MTTELTWLQLEVKQEKLKGEQKENLQLILWKLDKLGFEVNDYKETSDGWMDGFTVWQFQCIDRRDGSEKIFEGNDNNTALYELYENHGGKGLYWRDN